MASEETSNARQTDTEPPAYVDPRCRVEMLGPFRIVRDDQVLSRIARRKAVLLLAFLAIRPGLHAREYLTHLLWPDLDLPEGRDNLSTTLGSLRSQLEPTGVRRGSVLIASHTQIGLNPEAVLTDVALFEQGIDRAGKTAATAERVRLLEEARALYRGDLLPGIYEDWAILEMHRLQARLFGALQHLAQDQEALGDLEGALRTAQRHVSLEPFVEEVHCRLIRLHLLNGRPAAAREAEKRFERLFQEEFGAGLSRESRRTLEALFAEPVPPRLERSLPALAPSAVCETPSFPPSFSRSSWTPAVLIPCFGREQEIAQLVRLLLPAKELEEGPDLPEPAFRLVTLSGPGGIGKTRLALEFVRQAVDRFQAWCAFVSLAELTSPDQIVGQIAKALKIPPVSGADRLQQIIAYFQERDRINTPPELLVLDNWEHLLTVEDGHPPSVSADPLQSVRALLEQVSNLSLLCTSRRRLGLRSERLVEVTPLSLPDKMLTESDPHTLARLAAVPSVRLYLDRAQAVRLDFGLTPTNAHSIVALCRHLEGNPLALELAGAWVRTLPPRQMLERLMAGLDIPEGRYTDLPERHRSLSAALDWSYRLLTPDLQRLFARLSVFRGGWTAEAVAEVCEEPDALLALMQLLEASLITITEQETGEPRYGFLETMRAFSRQRLTAAGERERVQARHADFFAALAETASPHLRSADQALWLARLESERENLNAAMEWCFSDLNSEALRVRGVQMALALIQYWSVRGHWDEGEQWMGRALSSARALPDPLILARALSGAARFIQYRGDMQSGRNLHLESLAIYRDRQNLNGISVSLHNLGIIALRMRDYAQAASLYEESLELERQLGDKHGIADSLHHLGWAMHEQGELGRARTLYEESLEIRRALGDLRGMAYTLNNLGNLAFAQEDAPRAQALLQESLKIRQQLEDPSGIANSLQSLAHIAWELQNYQEAERHLQESLQIQQQLGDRRGIILSIEALAENARNQNRMVRAARLYGAAESLRVTMGLSLPAKSSAEWETFLSATQSANPDIASALAEGRQLTLEQSIDAALLSE
ncbi:MAG TPA: tetratricopeptide repeat protein [Chthonomonadaceae bacterium]|nr:tetratricopeptide repeat protein [Chthonomonadaceae bacterium]